MLIQQPPLNKQIRYRNNDGNAAIQILQCFILGKNVGSWRTKRMMARSVLMALSFQTIHIHMQVAETGFFSSKLRICFRRVFVYAADLWECNLHVFAYLQ